MISYMVGIKRAGNRLMPRRVNDDATERAAWVFTHRKRKPLPSVAVLPKREAPNLRHTQNFLCHIP